MRREHALTILRRNEPLLRSLGLRRLALFGSTARDSARVDSDVDIVVQFEQTARMDLFGFATLTDHLTAMLGRNVDVVTEPSRSERIQAMIDRDRVDVF